MCARRAVIALVLALVVIPFFVQARVDATQLAFVQVNMTQPSAAAGSAQDSASVTLDIRAVLSGLSPIGGKLLCTFCARDAVCTRTCGCTERAQIARPYLLC